MTRVTRRMPLLDQELLNLPEHLSSPRVCVVFVLLNLNLVFCIVVCRELFVLLSVFCWPLHRLSIYVFWLPLCHLQTFLTERINLYIELSSTSYILVLKSPSPNTIDLWEMAQKMYLIVVAIRFYYHIKSMCITYMYLTEHFVDWPYLRTNLNMISILLFKKRKSEHCNHYLVHIF